MSAEAKVWFEQFMIDVGGIIPGQMCGTSMFVWQGSALSADLFPQRIVLEEGG